MCDFQNRIRQDNELSNTEEGSQAMHRCQQRHEPMDTILLTISYVKASSLYSKTKTKFNEVATTNSYCYAS